jgi:hypothetical protein
MSYTRTGLRYNLRVASIPIYRKDFKALADLRIAEARILLARHREQGAYYLAGYAVECALKACIAKKTKKSQFPPKVDDVREMYFATNWSTVKDWTAESRYRSSGLNGKDMYNAVAGSNGVLPWIRLRW